MSSNWEVRNLEAAKVWDYENGFYWFSDASRILKTIAHFEIYKSIIHLPGEILEFGVYKGASLIRFASFRHALEAEKSRRIIGFDSFGKFPHNSENLTSDEVFIDSFEGAGGEGLSTSEMEVIFKNKGFGNVEFIQGDVLNTLPKYLSEHPEYRFALVHFDFDVYAPTRFALDAIWEKVIPGGILVFDDYGTVEGETRAVDEFIAKNSLTLSKLPYYKIPSLICKKN